MGVIVQIELNGTQFMEGYSPVKQMLEQVHWWEFIEKIDGFEKELTKSFDWSFDATKAKIGDIRIVVTKSFIANVTRLPRVGETWFKNRGIKRDDWRTFLKNPDMDITIFKKGIPWHSL